MTWKSTEKPGAPETKMPQTPPFSYPGPPKASVELSRLGRGQCMSKSITQRLSHIQILTV